MVLEEVGSVWCWRRWDLCEEGGGGICVKREEVGFV